MIIRNIFSIIIFLFFFISIKSQTVVIWDDSGNGGKTEITGKADLGGSIGEVIVTVKSNINRYQLFRGDKQLGNYGVFNNSEMNQKFRDNLQVQTGNQYFYSLKDYNYVPVTSGSSYTITFSKPVVISKLSLADIDQYIASTTQYSESYNIIGANFKSFDGYFGNANPLLTANSVEFGSVNLPDPEGLPDAIGWMRHYNSQPVTSINLVMTGNNTSSSNSQKVYDKFFGVAIFLAVPKKANVSRINPQLRMRVSQ